MAQDVGEVQEFVRDLVACPSPLAVAGSQHSLEHCKQSGVGTAMVMAGLDRVLSLSDAQGSVPQVGVASQSASVSV